MVLPITGGDPPRVNQTSVSPHKVWVLTYTRTAPSMCSKIALRLSVLFLGLALLSAVIALSGICQTQSWAARVSLLIFLLLFVITATANALGRQGGRED